MIIRSLFFHKFIGKCEFEELFLLFIKVIDIVSKYSKLSKTVGLFAVRLDLAKLRAKNLSKRRTFDQNLNRQNRSKNKSFLK